MKLWYNIIRESIARLRGGDMKGLNDKEINRRRSVNSLRNSINSWRDSRIDSQPGDIHKDEQLKDQCGLSLDGLVESLFL